MLKFYSKLFDGYYTDIPWAIDEWLRSMSRPELCGADGRDPTIVGYAPVPGGIVITISRWEKQKNDN